jgi:hypothetical protein
MRASTRSAASVGNREVALIVAAVNRRRQFGHISWRNPQGRMNRAGPIRLVCHRP